MSVETSKVTEGWSGPGRRDAFIEPCMLREDGLHIDLNKRGMYEWWYFDAHLDTGHTIVVFFHASNPNPGLAGKTGIEVVILRPDGIRNQKFFTYSKSDFSAARDWPEVTIGENTMRVERQNEGLPTYEINVDEEGLGCRLKFTAVVNGWKPGTGLSHFGDMGYFGWLVPFARGNVEGTIKDGSQSIKVTGVGYHDHNWLNFQFQKIIDYWMWGRVYSENFTMAYAYIQCNEKMNNHAVKVLMLAEGEEVILSTGEFDFLKEDFIYNSRAKHHFPRKITVSAPPELKASLEMREVLEAQDMLKNFNPLLRSIAKYILRLEPGYFRLLSDFELEVQHGTVASRESGTTLHEIVIFKPIL